MNHKFQAVILSLSFFFFTFALAATAAAEAQETPPTLPAPRKSGNRTSNVQIKPLEGAVENTGSVAASPVRSPSRQERKRAEEAASAERASARREAAALDREKQQARQDAEAAAKIETERVRLETEKREAELKAAFETERARENATRAAELEKLETERAARAREAEDLRHRLAAEAESRRQAEADALAERARAAEQAEAIRIETAKQVEAAKIAAEKLAEAIRVETERKAEQVRFLAQAEATRQLEEAARSSELAAAAALEKEKLRAALILEKARVLGYLAPDAAIALVPTDAAAGEVIEEALRAAAKANPSLTKSLNFCSPDFVGERFTFDFPSAQPLSYLLDEIRSRYGVNFLPDAEIVDAPVYITGNSVPWNFVLRSQLFNLDVEAVCYGTNTVSLIKRTKLLSLQDSQRKTAPLLTEYIELKHLRPVIAGQSNLAGKSTGAASVETVEQAIQKILNSGGDNRGSISRIPGRAEFIIKATADQIAEIRQVIDKADKPTYRVDVFGLVYTVNENKLKDVGSQLSAIVNTGGRLSGLTTLPQQSQTGAGGGTGGTTTGTGGLGAPFSQPGGFAAGSPNTILGARVRLGLVEFNYQLSLLEQLGVARRVEKPFVSAKDGTTGVFENGTQIPVIVQALNNLGGGSGGSIEFINAGTTLSATPQVIFENGVPKLVNLSLRLESNTPDLSIQTTGGVPSVNSRRIQNEITIAPNQAFIFGGSNDISDSNTVSRTPGVGEIPIIGNLFKRKTKQRTDNKLYFAVWVQISLDDGTSPVETDTLNTSFPKPPPMDKPLVLPSKNQ